MSCQCAGITREGRRCTRSAEGPNGYCWLHSPSHADQRRRAASRAGQSKPNAEVRTLKAEVSDIIRRIDAGDLDRNDAGVMLQGYRVLKDLVELDRRIHETEELAREVEGMREALESRKESRWGA